MKSACSCSPQLSWMSRVCSERVWRALRTQTAPVYPARPGAQCCPHNTAPVLTLPNSGVAFLSCDGHVVCTGGPEVSADLEMSSRSPELERHFTGVSPASPRQCCAGGLSHSGCCCVPATRNPSATVPETWWGRQHRAVLSPPGDTGSEEITQLVVLPQPDRTRPQNMAARAGEVCGYATLACHPCHAERALLSFLPFVFLFFSPFLFSFQISF